VVKQMLRPLVLLSQILLWASVCNTFSLSPCSVCRNKAHSISRKVSGHSSTALFFGSSQQLRGLGRGIRSNFRKVKNPSLIDTKAMFTGIVEEMGSVLNLEKDESGGGVTLKISCKVVLEGAYLGCSIAVNGVCLTVTEFDERQFTVSHDR
jgi:hypothetical protein